MPRTISQSGRPRRRTVAQAPKITRRPRRRTVSRTQARTSAGKRNAVRFRVHVKYENGLNIQMHIGPTWMGVLISVVSAVWLPQLESALKQLL